MKKIWGVILIFFFFVIPVNIYAIKIDSVSITGDKEKNPKEDVTLDFNVNFKEMEQGLDKTLGIWYVEFELIYDETVFQEKDISSPDFDVVLFQVNDSKKYYVFGEVVDNENSDKYCMEGMLYCSDYTVTIKFSIKDTTETSSTIQMTNVEVGLLDMVEPKEYTDDDVMLITHPNAATHTITIKQPVVSTNTNKNTNKNTNTNASTSTVVSRNLSSLEIEGYSIDFNKEETDYVVYVEKDTNSIKVNAITEDKKATVEVIGADDLKKSNHQVRVVVTATDKTKKTYYIKVKEKELDNEEDVKPKPLKKKVKTSSGSKNINKWIGIGLGIFIFLVIIGFVISKIKDHAIDKKLEKLDD